MPKKFITGHDSVRNLRCQCGWSMVIKTKSNETTDKKHVAERLHRKVCSGIATLDIANIVLGQNKQISNILDNLCGADRKTIVKEVSVRN